MTAAPLDPADLKAEHDSHVPGPAGNGCQSRPFRTEHHAHCLPYRLAAELAAAQEKLGRVRPAWSEGNPNDRTYEYVQVSDCHGEVLGHLRRLPSLVGLAGEWENATAEAYAAAKFPEEWRTPAGEGA